MASGVVQSRALPGMRVPSRAVRAGGKGLCVGEGRCVRVGGVRGGSRLGEGRQEAATGTQASRMWRALAVGHRSA